MKKTFSTVMILVVGILFLASCATLPKGARVVDHFEKEKYLGKWYEIARFDFAFERNLNNTTAEYSIRPDGTINVKNRGYNYVTQKWQEANGKARFRGDDTVAALEVSFFGPFYAAYNVIALDKDYQYALIAGSSLKYLWILSRTTTIPNDVRNEYLTIAQSLGYDVSKLIWVEHDR
jgi:apolipoprotein D and lipocalin family protein